MATRSVTFDILARDKASATVGKVGSSLDHLEKKAGAGKAAFSALNSTLQGMGGPFTVLAEGAERIGTAFEHVKEHGRSMTTVIQGAGIGLAATGALLAQLGEKDQAAQQQLRSSIEQTGHSYDEYEKQIEGAVRSQEKFGHTANDTEDALNTLTVATQSPTKALQDMALVANIAAIRHESLAAAADTLARAYSGSTRVFRQFGISISGTKLSAQQTDAAIKELSDRLNGQASAASNTFMGHIRALGTELHDRVAELGKWGPTLMAVGASLTIVTTAMDLLAARKARQIALDSALIVKEGELAAVERAEGAAALTAGEEGAAGMAARGGAGAVGAGGMAARAGRFGGAAAFGPVGAFAAVEAIVGPTQVKELNSAFHGKKPSVFGLLATGGLSMFADTLGAVTGQQHKHAKAAKDDADATKKAGDAAKQGADGFKKLGDAVSITESDVTGMVNALNSYVSARGNDQATLDGFMKSINDLGDAVKSNGSKALEGYTDAAIANREALRNLAGQELARIDILRKHGATSAKARDEAIKMSSALEDQATKVFGDKAAVDKFLGSLHLLPSQVKTDIKLTGADAAIAAAKSVADQIRAIPPNKTIVLTVNNQTGNTAAVSAGQRGRRVGMAEGGWVTGGIPGVDSVPTMLMPGEFVVRRDGSNLAEVAGKGSAPVRIHPFDVDAIARGVASGVANAHIVTDRSALDRRGGRAVMAAV